MAVQALSTLSDAIDLATSPPAACSAEAELWDRFVEGTPGGDLVQTTAWAQAKRALGFEHCHVISRRGDEILGGGQIIIKRFGPLGALGYVARGPLVRSENREQAEPVLAEIERAARTRRVRHLIVQPPEGGDNVVAALVARGYTPDAPEVAPTATMRIDLSQSVDQILARMSAGKRGHLRRSQRHGIEVTIGGQGDVDLFHSLYEQTARRQGFRALSQSYLREHWAALHPKGAAQSFFAYHNGRPLAAVWLTALGDTVTYRLTGWNGEGRRLQPNIACLWGAIRWAKEQGYRYFDFGGIDRCYAELILAKQPLPEEFHRTPGALKREFGSDAVLLPRASQYTFHPLARLVVRALYPKLARRKPLRVLMDHIRCPERASARSTRSIRDSLVMNLCAYSSITSAMTG